MKKLIASIVLFLVLNPISNVYADNQADNTSSLPKLKLEQQQQASEISIGDKEIKIIALKGTDLFTNADGSNLKNNTPKAYFEPKGDFIFSAKVSPIFSSAYDGGALYVHIDENNWAKLLFEQFKSGSFGVASTVSKTQGDDAYHSFVEAPSVYLKIVRMNSMYVFYTSSTGGEWHYLRSFGFKNVELAKIGFTAQSPSSDRVPVTFSDIKLEHRTIKDFWQGN
jgi:regulation of enolase protein 1 (concanavalin A-like superfamily)